jgi:hypothetical protein
MKWLFYLLVLANLAFFAWNRLTEQPDSQAPAAVAQNAADGAHLVLLHELPPSERPPARTDESPPAAEEKPAQPAAVPAAASPMAADAVPGANSPEKISTSAAGKEDDQSVSEKSKSPAKPASVCYRIGGIADAEAADALGARLEKAGAAILQRGKEPGTRTNYWVFLPAFPSRAAARPALRQLQQHGFKDYYLVRSGENENAVSLGVFSERSRAERRYRQIRGFGLKPQLDELVMPTQHHYVSFRWPTSKSAAPSAVLGDIQAKPPEKLTCP